MKTVYKWWKFDNVIDDATIEKIMSIGEGEWQDAGIGYETDAERVNANNRKTDIIWNNENWLYELFWPYMLIANEYAGWNLDVDCAESFQLGRYADGGHYEWHSDGEGFIVPLDAKGVLRGKTRKISMVCWLNDDFEGGEFEFFECYAPDGLIKPTKGTVVLFPSWLVHKVHPVTKGTRYSLVTWFNGYPVR